MKTYAHLYPTVCSFENLYAAYCAARRGKRCLTPVATFAREQEAELLQLQSELRSLTYQPGPYHSFYIHDPKRRLISAAPFRDRVIHHALVRVIEPIWERRFIFDTYANRVGKGTHRALARCQQFAQHFRYVLQCDLKQFFPSVDHALLLNTLAHHIADRPTLELCARILASGVGVLSEAYDMVYFSGDDLWAAERARGLPIGNLTSQFWANVYLNQFDHFVKHMLKCAGYVRYVDDFLLFSNDKSQLGDWRAQVIEQLAQLRLTMHAARAQVTPVQVGIPFLGFRIYATHRRLKSRLYLPKPTCSCSGLSHKRISFRGHTALGWPRICKPPRSIFRICYWRLARPKVTHNSCISPKRIFAWLNLSIGRGFVKN